MCVGVCSWALLICVKSIWGQRRHPRVTLVAFHGSGPDSPPTAVTISLLNLLISHWRSEGPPTPSPRLDA
ncbi:hypothetical protein HAX54_046904, partial [Datura stramonium]|nr:hypothetical protein [Datura stramonium]